MLREPNRSAASSIDRIVGQDGAARVQWLDSCWEVATPIRTVHVGENGSILKMSDPYDVDWRHDG